MENSDINIRLDDFSDISRSTDAQNRDIDGMFETLRTDIKEIKYQIIELKTQINNLESKVCV